MHYQELFFPWESVQKSRYLCFTSASSILYILFGRYDMKDSTSQYSNPLIERYAGHQMSSVFSPDFKFQTWRRLWVALAQSEMELGLNISSEQVDEMRGNIENIDYKAAAAHEKEVRHDVMAHVLTFGEICPKARPIIHLGATSAYVGDNTDLIQLKEAGKLLLGRGVALLKALRSFALEQKSRATLGFTHYQPAQLTTVGKRACLWMQDFCLDLEDLNQFVRTLPFRGVKGTTGTQASFLNLFEGDHEKVRELDKRVSRKMGFSDVLPVTGQTYTRKIDAKALAILSGFAQSFHKVANDIRLLQNLKEIEEPFGKSQIGSSAMAYKRNPMRSERLTALSRYIMSLASSPAMTAAEQWFERTLDDSANKRLSVPEAFLAADACFILATNVCSGLVVYPKVIEKHIGQELPFMATENILMEAVKRGGDRQTLHEKIRTYSHEAGARVKQDGLDNDLLSRITSDAAFGLSKQEIEQIVKVEDFVGRSPQQVDEFITDKVDPLLSQLATYETVEETELRV